MATTIFTPQMLRNGTRAVPEITGGGVTPFSNTKSLLFDGSDDYLDVGSIAMVNSVNKLSFSVWIKKLSFATQSIVLGRTGSSSIYDGVYIIVRTSGKISFAIGQGYWITVDTISLNTWTHIACVFDGTLTGNENRAKIYINGILKGGTIFNNPIPNITGTGLNTTFNIGATGNPSGPSAFFNGNIDEVSLYDYSLSASEVTDIYNLGTPTDLSLLSTPPLHWYRNGDNDTYPTIADVGSLASNSGTMTNMDAGDIVSDVPL